MKLLHIAENIPTPRKKENKVILEILKRLNKKHTNQIIYPSPYVPFGAQFIKKYNLDWRIEDWQSGSFNIKVFKYIRLPMKGYAFKFLQKAVESKLSDYVIKKDFDLIHAHWIFPDGGIAYFLSLNVNLDYIISVRNSEIRNLNRISQKSFDFKLAKKVLSGAKFIHVFNSQQKIFIKSKFGLEAKIIPHGIDPSIISTPKEFQNKNSEGKNIISISCVSKLINGKNIEWVIQAVKEYKGSINIKLDIVGNGPKMGKLQKMVIGNPNINLLGWLNHENALNVLRKSDIFALPTEIDTFGIVFLEAAAKGNAVICHKYAGVWELFKENEEMIYVNGYKDFKTKLYALIENEKQINKLAHNLYTSIHKFSWNNIINRYQNIYKEAANE